MTIPSVWRANTSFGMRVASGSPLAWNRQEKARAEIQHVIAVGCLFR